MAGEICKWTQQPNNCAAFRHASVQCASFIHGHGKFDPVHKKLVKISSQDSCIKGVTFRHVFWRDCISYSQPGGYSKLAFSMVCGLRTLDADIGLRNEINRVAAQIERSHMSWCAELSPLLTRYCIPYLQLGQTAVGTARQYHPACCNRSLQLFSDGNMVAWQAVGSEVKHLLQVHVCAPACAVSPLCNVVMAAPCWIFMLPSRRSDTMSNHITTGIWLHSHYSRLTSAVECAGWAKVPSTASSSDAADARGTAKWLV